MATFRTRGRTIKTQYPCCGKPCTLKVTDEETWREEVVERRHFCDAEQVNGTLWRISRKLLTHEGGTGVRIDRVEFLDLASTEAEQMYGERRVPHRTVTEEPWNL